MHHNKAQRFFLTTKSAAQDAQFNFSLVGRGVTRSFLERGVGGSNLRPVKSDIVLPMARHRCNISLKKAVLSGCNDAEIDHVNSLHASA